VAIRTDPVTLARDKFQLLILLRQYLREGGFPRVVLEQDESLKREYLRSYYDSIVYQDIILINQVRNVRALKDLLYYLFSNVSRLYSYRTLQDLLQIDFPTLKEFIEYAADAKALFEVQYFSYSLKT
jgi:predicted AAA+ superfamily ATPase